MTAEQNNIPILNGPEILNYRGRLFDLVTQPMLIGSKEFQFEKVRRPPGVRLIIRSNKGNILLTREYRSETRSWDYRLPGGKVFDTIEDFNLALQTNQDIVNLALQAARKEGLEEAGIQLSELTHLHTSICGATVDWDLYYYETQIATEEAGEQHLEEGENILTDWHSSQEILNYLFDGSFSEDRSAAVLFRYLYHLQQNSDYTDQNEEKNVGVKLIQLLQSVGLASARPRIENLLKLEQIDAVFIVGSSFTGKSTLVDALRDAIANDPEQFRSISIPKRVITRPQRQNDNLIENSFATPDEFSEMVKTGEIGMHWVRKMEGNRTERYGFLQPPTGTLPIYSANNAIVNNKESIFPPGLRERSFIIAVYAPEDLRKDRLMYRSPDLVNQKPEEVAYRLLDKAAYMYPDAHVVIKNFGRFQGSSKADITNLIKLIIKSRL